MKNSFLIILLAFIASGYAFSQTGQVPELVNVETAARLVNEKMEAMQIQINEILQGGGQVDQGLQSKHDLYKAVLDILVAHNSGMTTFYALASNCNYKELTTDEEAHEEFMKGNWDENMTSLIELLTK
ncbi:MAG: hypothetical protein IPM34_06215 [Saprospiraceae bacterium]|nr:hypothetical protein [Saprospiraceae bacterium]